MDGVIAARIRAVRIARGRPVVLEMLWSHDIGNIGLVWVGRADLMARRGIG